jgi:hypothetical protein
MFEWPMIQELSRDGVQSKTSGGIRAGGQTIPKHNKANAGSIRDVYRGNKEEIIAARAQGLG